MQKENPYFVVGKSLFLIGKSLLKRGRGWARRNVGATDNAQPSAATKKGHASQRTPTNKTKKSYLLINNYKVFMMWRGVSLV